MIFSATGIGGSSIALDASGNIYLAGSSPGTDYPTTPGAYQTALVQGYSGCGNIACTFFVSGNLQHVTKVDPAASKLIYSTGLNDPTGAAGSTTNTGLAIDAAGNAYLTGTLFAAQYPFTVTAPDSSSPYLPSGYLTKLDPAGANVLFSIPAGGAGVQLDSSGAVYVGGIVSTYSPPTDLSILLTTPLAPPPIFSWIPQQCWPDNITALSEAYVLKVDPDKRESAGRSVDRRLGAGRHRNRTGCGQGLDHRRNARAGRAIFPRRAGARESRARIPGRRLFVGGRFFRRRQYRAGDCMRVGWRQPDTCRPGCGVPGALDLRHESGTRYRSCGARWNRYLHRRRIHNVQWRSRAVAVRFRIADQRGGSGAASSCNASGGRAALGDGHAIDGERRHDSAAISIHRIQHEFIRRSVHRRSSLPGRHIGRRGIPAGCDERGRLGKFVCASGQVRFHSFVLYARRWRRHIWISAASAVVERAGFCRQLLGSRHEHVVDR